MKHQALKKASLQLVALSFIASAFSACGESKGKTGSLNNWNQKSTPISGTEINVQSGDTLLT